MVIPSVRLMAVFTGLKDMPASPWSGPVGTLYSGRLIEEQSQNDEERRLDGAQEA